jgi:hypothetical protein
MKMGRKPVAKLMGMQYLQLVARREAADRTTAELHKQKEELARVRIT